MLPFFRSEILGTVFNQLRSKFSILDIEIDYLKGGEGQEGRKKTVETAGRQGRRDRDGDIFQRGGGVFSPVFRSHKSSVAAIIEHVINACH